MSIEQIISALKERRSLVVTPAQLEKVLADQGMTPDQVTEDLIDAIATELTAPKGAIAVAPKGGKATTRKKRGSTEQAAQPIETLQTVLPKAAKNTGVEIGAMVEAVKDWSDNTALMAGTEIYNQIKATSGKTVLQIAKLAAEDEADPNHFRAAIGDILQAVELPI